MSIVPGRKHEMKTVSLKPLLFGAYAADIIYSSVMEENMFHNGCLQMYTVDIPSQLACVFIPWSTLVISFMDSCVSEWQHREEGAKSIIKA